MADNGGPTWTHALLAGSPAIDAGDSSLEAGNDAPLYDQRGEGFDRIRDGNGIDDAVIDIGAFEVQEFVAGPALPGDYNLDEVVDAADYTVWRDTLGQAVANHYDGADGDGDGTVDPDDYQVWKDHFGDVLEEPVAAAPVVLAPVAPAAIEEPVATPMPPADEPPAPPSAKPSLPLVVPVPVALVHPSRRETHRAAPMPAVSWRDEALLAWLATRTERTPSIGDATAPHSADRKLIDPGGLRCAKALDAAWESVHLGFGR